MLLQAWYYSHSGQLVNRRDYLGSVTAVKLNSSWAAVLTGGLVVVHPIQVTSEKRLLSPDGGWMVTQAAEFTSPKLSVTWAGSPLVIQTTAKDQGQKAKEEKQVS